METENSKVPWCVIDAARTIEEVEQDVHRHAEETIARVDEGALPSSQNLQVVCFLSL